MSRRNANGEGSIWLRKDGRWCAGAYVRTVGNRVERRYVYGRTRKEVVAKLVDLQKRHNDGYAAGSTTLTVEQFLGEWLSHVPIAFGHRPTRGMRTTSGYTLCPASGLKS